MDELRTGKVLEKFVGINEVAEHFGYSRRTIDRFIKEGMPHYKGKPNKFLLSECVKWFKTNKWFKAKEGEK